MVSPSLLSADFGSLERDIRMLNGSDADWYHLDVMDGVFVPNISFGFPVMEAMARSAAKPLDVHLMTVDPERYTERVARLGARVMSVHQEACRHLHRTLQEIKSAGMMAGVVLNPATPVGMLEDVVGEADVVMLMSVNPGFGGQKFIPQTLRKVGKLKSLITAAGARTLIEVDGGVNLETGRALVEAGADVLVAGSFVFRSANPVETISELRKL